MTTCELPAQRAPNSIHVPLFKNENADQDFATWPPAVQNIMVRELNGWAARNPDLDTVEQNYSFDAGRRVCVTEFHYSNKAVTA